MALAPAPNRRTSTKAQTRTGVGFKSIPEPGSAKQPSDGPHKTLEGLAEESNPKRNNDIVVEIWKSRRLPKSPNETAERLSSFAWHAAPSAPCGKGLWASAGGTRKSIYFLLLLLLLVVVVVAVLLLLL